MLKFTTSKLQKLLGTLLPLSLEKSPVRSGSRWENAPGVNRTRNLVVRSHSLYPIELRARDIFIERLALYATSLIATAPYLHIDESTGARSMIHEPKRDSETE